MSVNWPQRLVSQFLGALKLHKEFFPPPLRDGLGNGESRASREATDKGRLPCTLKLRDAREVALHKPE